MDRILALVAYDRLTLSLRRHGSAYTRLDPLLIELAADNRSLLTLVFGAVSVGQL